MILNNIQKENALLHDREIRLVKDVEFLNRDKQSANLMQTNIELIKATLERNDAEARIRLEERVDEAHRECAAMRRRLQEEQDRFRQLTEHLEKQTHTAQAAMEEEKLQADKLRQELAQVNYFSEQHYQNIASTNSWGNTPYTRASVSLKQV